MRASGQHHRPTWQALSASRPDGRALPAASIPEDEFYATPRPAPKQTIARLRPVRLGGLLFAIGWAGILLQRNFLQQLVVGAPVFEEFAKFGPALVMVSMLGATRLAARLPYAWLSGAAFGAFEHYFSYAGEGLTYFGVRVAFHAGAAGLSMAAYGLYEQAADGRMRWFATLPSTLLHWANNFGVLALAVAFSWTAYTDAVQEVWSMLVTSAVFVFTFVGVKHPHLLARDLADRLTAHLPGGPPVPAPGAGQDPPDTWEDLQGD